MGDNNKEISNDTEPKSWLWWPLVFVIGALVTAAGILTILRNYFQDHHSQQSSVSDNPNAVVKKYADALEIALQFFEVQKSGKMVNNRVTWRGDSGLRDGSEEKLDLSKGMYDAGDHMKFGFPLAFTATVLAWGILEYGDQMNAVNQLEHAQESLKWISDYLINAHPSANVLYIQVGDPEIDHNCWERPENMKERRPATEVNASYPGTEVAAETAAALASASLVFNKINPSYSNLLTQQLFTFADNFRVSYSVSIPQVQNYYNSSGYVDELLWAASWLYHATGDLSYLKYVTMVNGQVIANWGSPTWFSWNDKLSGTQVLLSRINIFGARGISTVENLDLQVYRKTAEARLLPDSPTATSSRTDGGLIWIDEWKWLLHV